MLRLKRGKYFRAGSASAILLVLALIGVIYYLFISGFLLLAEVTA
jgi:hypothetical protein